MRIETERLVIRSFLESDAHAYAAIAADPDVMKHTGEGLPQSFDSSRDYVLRCIRSYETRGYARYAVCLKAENGLPIGFCGFMDDNGELEFGWRYGKPYWGRGWQSVAGPFRVARGGLRVSGAKRGAERWFHIVTDERQSLWPEPPCAQRVTAASGHLPRCPSSIDGGTSTSSWRLAYGPMALVTRSLQGPATDCYATEAARAVLDYALQTPAILRIVCLCESGNIASIRVIEKLGMELVGQDTWKGKPLFRYMPAAS